MYRLIDIPHRFRDLKFDILMVHRLRNINVGYFCSQGRDKFILSYFAEIIGSLHTLMLLRIKFNMIFLACQLLTDSKIIYSRITAFIYD
jgi:hypothetical protein